MPAADDDRVIVHCGDISSTVILRGAVLCGLSGDSARSALLMIIVVREAFANLFIVVTIGMIGET